MRALLLVLGGLAVFPVASFAGATPPADAGNQPGLLNFSIIRNGQQIGTSSVRLRHNGREMTADVTTHIEVKIAFVTVYRFEQSESERWIDGHLATMTAVTNDNGTTHRVSATSRGDKLLVESDGRTSEGDRSLMPFSPWNAELLRRTMVLSTNDGRITPLSVTDRGEEQLVLRGQPTTAHHYSVRTSFPQDLWYDQQRRLVQVELRGSDGSKIQYQPG